MNVRFQVRLPWPLAFSFARAIQQRLWRFARRGSPLVAAQQALHHRARATEPRVGANTMQRWKDISMTNSLNLDPAQLDQLAINTIRFLSVDAVEKANSGHPGLPMALPNGVCVVDAASPAIIRQSSWFNRDRFVLSAGHGSMLLYSLLHLTGYDLPLEQIKQFRQWAVKLLTPRARLTPAWRRRPDPSARDSPMPSVSRSRRIISQYLQPPGHLIVNHYTYALVSDGDLMEGVASEAASLAGHLKLAN